MTTDVDLARGGVLLRWLCLSFLTGSVFTNGVALCRWRSDAAAQFKLLSGCTKYETHPYH
jgi:hypothetical protein